jgi:hypothetical protein
LAAGSSEILDLLESAGQHIPICSFFLVEIILPSLFNRTMQLQIDTVKYDADREITNTYKNLQLI